MDKRGAQLDKTAKRGT